MVGMIESLAQANSIQVTTELIAEGGMTLSGHLYNVQVLDLIRSGSWDYIVLQEQSTLPLENYPAFENSVSRFNKEIVSSGSKTVLFCTWAREHIPEMFKELEIAYQSAAKRSSATVVPIGLAWNLVKENRPTIPLYEQDKSHPSQLGSYLSACVFACHLLGIPSDKIPGRIALFDGVYLDLDGEIMATFRTCLDKTLVAQSRVSEGVKSENLILNG